MKTVFNWGKTDSLTFLLPTMFGLINKTMSDIDKV